MSNAERESETVTGDSLELNKETLQDLDVEAIDTRDVKGGGLTPAAQAITTNTSKISETGQITPYRPGELTPAKSGIVSA